MSSNWSCVEHGHRRHDESKQEEHDANLQCATHPTSSHCEPTREPRTPGPTINRSLPSTASFPPAIAMTAFAPVLRNTSIPEVLSLVCTRGTQALLIWRQDA
eukprot:1182643-Prorocentrum_minimum.AAC.1